MIEFRNVKAGYPGRDVLKDVNLTIRPGRVLVLLGPNGCGKSTLLRTVLGLQPRTSGQVLLDGIPVEQYTRRQLAQRIAYLPQSRAVPNISVQRMVLHGRFPYLSYPRRYRREDLEAAREALRRVDAEDLAGSFLPNLSGGQRQKVYLAMALVQDTETILMDEPTTYLDIRHQLETMDMARQLAAEGTALVLVLHDLCMAMRVADEAAVLFGGKILCSGTPEQVFLSGTINQTFGITLERVRTEQGWQYYCL